MFQRFYLLHTVLILFTLLGQSTGMDVQLWSNPSDDLQESSPTTRILTFEDLGYSGDETLQGVLVNRNYTINWPDSWVAKPGNSLTLEFSHSPVLEDYSSMAVDWNGIRLASVLFTPGNANHGSLKITIPENLIKTGYNQLSLELYMGIYDDPCEDPNNPATWATIHSSSFFEFAYELATPLPDLNLYPLPIIDNSSWIENNVTFIIPDDPSVAELSALTSISAKLGQLAAWRTLNIEVISESWIEELAPIKGNMIYIGQADHLSVLKSGDFSVVSIDQSGINFVSPVGELVDEKSGILWIQVSQYDPHAVEIIVSGRTDEALMLAAQGLASEEVYRRLHGQLGVVYEVPKPESPPKARQVIALEELGYTDQTARGTFNQTINFIVPLTMQWQVLTEATLDLHFAHSELLHPERSSLTVVFNDSPVGSILLDKNNAQDGTASFKLPARLLEIGDNKLTFITNIKVLEDYIDPYDCTEEYYHEAWVVVNADSSITLPTGPTSLTLDLADYPFPFIGAVDLSDTTFIVPDAPNRTIADALANVAGRLGRYTEGKSLFPSVAGASDISSGSVTPPNQFLFGEPTENPVIFSLNDILPLPFINGTDEARRIEGIAQILPPSGTVGYIQAALTEDNQPRLVITGDSLESIQWAADALSEPELLRELKGDLVILDAPNSIYGVMIHSASVPWVESPFPETPSSNTLRPAGWVIWLSGSIMLLTLTILFVLAWSLVVKQRNSR